MKYDTATPYLAAYVIIRNDGKIPFVLRANTAYMNGYYGLAAGKVEKGEPFSLAAIREAEEEIGIIIDPAHLVHSITCYRYEADDDSYWVDVYFEASSWKGEVINGEPEKHSEVTWLSPKDLPNNVVPATKFALEQLAAGKTYCEYGWE